MENYGTKRSCYFDFEIIFVQGMLSHENLSTKRPTIYQHRIGHRIWYTQIQLNIFCILPSKKYLNKSLTKHHTKSIYIDKDFLEEKCIKNNYKIEHNWLVVSTPLKKYARQNGKIFPNFPGGHAKYVETTAQKFFHHHSSLRKFRQFPLPLIPWAVFRCNAWDAKHSWMRGAKSTLERNKGLGRTTQLERVLKPKDWQLTKETFRDVESWRSWTVFFFVCGVCEWILFGWILFCWKSHRSTVDLLRGGKCN